MPVDTTEKIRPTENNLLSPEEKQALGQAGVDPEEEIVIPDDALAAAPIFERARDGYYRDVSTEEGEEELERVGRADPQNAEPVNTDPDDTEALLEFMQAQGGSVEEASRYPAGQAPISRSPAQNLINAFQNMKAQKEERLQNPMRYAMPEDAAALEGMDTGADPTKIIEDVDSIDEILADSDEGEEFPIILGSKRVWARVSRDLVELGELGKKVDKIANLCRKKTRLVSPKWRPYLQGMDYNTTRACVLVSLVVVRPKIDMEKALQMARENGQVLMRIATKIAERLNPGGNNEPEDVTEEGNS